MLSKLAVVATAAGTRAQHAAAASWGARVFIADPDRVMPFVHEDEGMLSLHFGISAIQSRMRRDDPAALELDYTRAMMGCLLFVAQPKAMLMIGLGGGSLPKYCRKQLPQADITVVEINPHVIAMRETFCVPLDDVRFRVLYGDGAAFVATTAQRFDVILVDGFTYEGQPESLSTPAFYADCRLALAAGGVLVVNLDADDDACALLTDRITDTFDGAALAISAADRGNRIAFATEAAAIRRCRAEFRQRLAALDDVHRHMLRGCADRLACAMA
jgi:spermidine synthase